MSFLPRLTGNERPAELVGLQSPKKWHGVCDSASSPASDAGGLPETIVPFRKSSHLQLAGVLKPEAAG